MTAVSQIRMWLVAGVLTGVIGYPVPAGAAAEVAPSFTPLAHSAQLTLETASAPAELTLHLERTQGTTPLAVTDLTVAIDGSNAAVTRRGDDTWSVPWRPSGTARRGQLEVVVTHDGIREVLSGTLPGPAAGPAGGSAGAGGAAEAGHTGGLRDHKQLAWWILNIVVVLIAAIAISRRTS